MQELGAALTKALAGKDFVLFFVAGTKMNLFKRQNPFGTQAFIN